MSRFTFTTYIDREGDEIAVRVTYTVTPFIAATYWQPAEGGEVEVEFAEFVHERAYMPSPITDDEWDALTDEAAGRARDDLAEEASARDEYLADLRREDRMLCEWERGL